MDLWEAFDQMADLFTGFLNFLFSDLYTFFDIDSDGILQFWPFFIMTLLFVFFCIIKAVIRTINDI